MFCPHCFGKFEKPLRKLPPLKARGGWQRQKAKKEQNLKKILSILKEYGSLRWTDILQLSSISRKVLSLHLTLLEQQGKISQDEAGRRYSLRRG
jgi:DNA-binding HxlR family transcriptional regulator